MSEVLHECEVCGAPVVDENRDKHNRDCHSTEATFDARAWLVAQKRNIAIQHADRVQGCIDALDAKDAEIKRLRAIVSAAHDARDEIALNMGRDVLGDSYDRVVDSIDFALHPEVKSNG